LAIKGKSQKGPIFKAKTAIRKRGEKKEKIPAGGGEKTTNLRGRMQKQPGKKIDLGGLGKSEEI